MTKRLELVSGSKKLVIEHDLPEVGCYLYVYEGGCCIHDSLQDTEELAKEEAHEKWGVEESEWPNEPTR
ncbi:hypothetical protein [Agarivorans albus]|uniref:hypothetical protein n=1 Tax=Agarivorans albus TaxID=182262 RepID=UPI0005900C29|nr:hypothetical protein [Agarivorans albus]